MKQEAQQLRFEEWEFRVGIFKAVEIQFEIPEQNVLLLIRRDIYMNSILFTTIMSLRLLIKSGVSRRDIPLCVFPLDHKSMSLDENRANDHNFSLFQTVGQTTSTHP